MPDTSLEILIKTLADTHGAEAVQKALNGVTAETKLNTGATLDTAAAAEKATVSKANLKAAIKGLSYEFPILGHAMRLAINPIAGIVAVTAGAFALWKARVNELQQTFNSLELPDLKDFDPAQVSAIAGAVEQLNTAVRKVNEAFSSSESNYKRQISNIEKRLELDKKLLESNKALELSEARTPEQKLEIESRYSNAAMLLDREAGNKKLARLIEEQAALERSARDKLIEAEKLKPGFGGATEQSEAQLKAQSDAAKADIEKRKEKITDLTEFIGGNAGFWQSLRVKNRQLLTGMSPEELLAADRDELARAQSPIDRFAAFGRAKAINQQKALLISSAAADRSRAAEIGLQIPERRAELEQSAAVDQRVALQRQTWFTNPAQPQGQQQGQQQSAHMAEAAIALNSNSSRADRATVNALRALAQWKLAVENEIMKLRDQLKHSHTP